MYDFNPPLQGPWALRVNRATFQQRQKSKAKKNGTLGRRFFCEFNKA
jgi:hypothetical protein